MLPIKQTFKQTNANGISDNAIAIQKEAAARKSEIAMTNFKAGLEKQERENADKKLEQKIDKNATDILVEKKNRESAVAMVDNKVNLEKQERENNDAKLDAKIDKNATAILVEKKNRESAVAMVDNKVNLERQERENNDAKLDAKINKETKDREFGEFKLNTKIDAEGEARVANDKILNNKIDKETKDREFGEFKLNTKINAEGEARVAGDELLNKKIDSNAAKVQEQLDAQVNKNNAQDASIKANGAAIKANKDAIKANADAIKANKDAADATNTYFNGRIENNTANIDKNKVAIENEAKDRKDADQKLQKQIDKNGIKADTALKVIGNGAMQNGATNLTDGVNQNTRLVEAEAKARDDADKAEAKAREEADTKLQNNINAEATTRENAVNALNSRIDQVGSDATKGIAKASALAALHPLDYDPDNKFDIAAAGGFYKGENAFALGAFYRPNRNVMLSMGTTLTSGDNAYNVGVTFKIGKSGKHTEAGLTTADLYAMIGAMQDKMDQQQKKIEELEAKQAK